MNEKKKIIVIGSVIGGLLLLLILVGVLQKNAEKKEVNNNSNTVTYHGKYSTDYEKAFEGEGKKVLFVGSSTCGVCSAFTPYMKYLSEAYNFTYYYIDASSMNTDTLYSLWEKIGKGGEDITTPYVAFLENGKKYEEIKGYLTEAGLFTTLQENGIIGENETYVSSTEASSGSSSTGDETKTYQNLTFIDYEQYEEIYNSDEKAIVVIGQTGCSACSAFKPVINEIAKEYDITIYYVNLTNWTNREAYDLMGSLSYFKERESFGTPLTVIIENKDNVTVQEGHKTKDTTVQFFKNNGFIKES